MKPMGWTTATAKHTIAKMIVANPGKAAPTTGTVSMQQAGQRLDSPSGVVSAVTPRAMPRT